MKFFINKIETIPIDKRTGRNFGQLTHYFPKKRRPTFIDPQNTEGPFLVKEVDEVIGKHLKFVKGQFIIIVTTNRGKFYHHGPS